MILFIILADKDGIRNAPLVYFPREYLININLMETIFGIVGDITPIELGDKTAFSNNNK